MQAGTPTMSAPTRKGGATNERRHYATRGFQGRRTVARTAERGCRRHAGPGGGGQLRRRRRHSRLGRPCRPVTWVGVARWWRRVRGRMPASGGAGHERYRTRRYRHVRRSHPIHPSGPARSTRVPCEIERGPYTHAPEAGGIGSIAHDAPACRPVQARAVSSRKRCQPGFEGGGHGIEVRLRRQLLAVGAGSPAHPFGDGFRLAALDAGGFELAGGGKGVLVERLRGRRRGRGCERLRGRSTRDLRATLRSWRCAAQPRKSNPGPDDGDELGRHGAFSLGGGSGPE